jgi:N-acetylmuramoyl-L-alanine amidase
MQIITRADWGAKPASLPTSKMSLPAEAIFCHHSVTPVTGDPAADMRTIESIGLQRFGQYSYSYAIHPRNGEILEGCGLRRGAHTAGRNSTSFGVCWIGDYTTRAPKVQQIDATRWLIHHLKTQGHLIPDAIVRGHRDVMATACPGDKLYAVLGDIRRPWEEPKEVAPMFSPPLVLEPIVAELSCPSGGVWLLAGSGAIYGFGGAPYLGSPAGKDYFAGRKAARLQLVDNKYRVIAESGESYGPGF